MTMKVNEIFYSLQGEGSFTGVPAVFLRLSGCNLSCGFCDTLHHRGRTMSEEEILDEISAYPSRHIVITGGEPAMQTTPEFIGLLHRNGWFVQIETNGTLPVPPEIDWITCSPKTGTVACGRVDEIKLLFMGNEEDRARIARFECIPARIYCLQPCDHSAGYSNDSPAAAADILAHNRRTLEKCISYIKENPKWRLSIQTHKLLDIP